MHRIDGGRKGPCLQCIAKLEAQHEAKGEAAKSRKFSEGEQRNLFGEAA